MKRFLGFLSVLLLAANLYSQNITIDTTGLAKLNAQYQIPPKFPGNINSWLAKNIISNGQAEGEAYVSFVVQTDGRVVDIKILRVDPPMMNNNLGQAALKIMYAMPKWSPAMQNGKPIEATYSLGFIFGH